MRQCRATKGALAGALMGALMAVATMTPAPALSATPGLTASELKAVFLLRLPQFVTWPDGHVVFGADATLVSADAAVPPLLWVSDQLGYARGGGMVELQRRGARIGLVVNLLALESAGLKASSKLLQLSDVIGGADGS